MRALTNKRIRDPLPEHNGYQICDDLQRFRNTILRTWKKAYIYDNHAKIARISAGFDIETTRVQDRAYMYHWQFSFNKILICGRTWEKFVELVDMLNTWLNWQKAIIIVWVANLGHEFSFLGPRFQWKNIFAVATHEPLKAKTGRIEFRECLSISGQGGLKNLAKNYTTTQKAVNDLDYSVSRNSMTELSITELGYCYADVEILSEWGDYVFSNFPDNSLRIPLTATGIVRSHILKAAQDTGRYEDIRKAIWDMFPQTVEEYNYIMLRLFRGGYTHANMWYAGSVEKNIIGVDFTSSYPAVMLHNENYQRTSFVRTQLQHDGVHITDERIRSGEMCCWFVAKFYGIRATTEHSIESKHKLDEVVNGKFDNGRLYYADMIQVALTETDYKVYEMFYEWDALEIIDARTAFCGPLPEYVLKPMRHFYKIKSRLKRSGQDGTIEYINAKSICNSMYGCTVTRLKFLEAKYNQDTHEWKEEPQDKSYDELRKNQILSPYWGIQITSNARYALLSTIFRLENQTDEDLTDEDLTDDQSDGPQVLYCDTDSIYMFDSPRNRAIIAEYNDSIMRLNAKYEKEFDDLGCFDWVGKDKKTGEPFHYLFKSLGAKRYVKYHDGVAEVTVAGLPKGALEKMLVRPFATDNSYIAYENPKKKEGRLGFVDIDDLFDSFTDSMLLNCEISMKNRIKYNPDRHSDTVTDPDGNTEIMTEESSAAIVPTSFQLTMEPFYKQLIEVIMKERRKPLEN